MRSFFEMFFGTELKDLENEISKLENDIQDLEDKNQILFDTNQKLRRKIKLLKKGKANVRKRTPK
ncbi:MAG TPA: hypothetical protein PLO52_00370 [Flavobacterium alvei]|nr:hypothetical protein [Flavobacterium alvei]